MSIMSQFPAAQREDSQAQTEILLPSTCELTIVMPCLNEAETLEVCILKAQRYLESEGIDGEIVIGDNGSTDGSQDIARRCGARVIDVPIRGYGAALHFATKQARGKYVIMGDSDDSYDFSDLNAFLDRLRAGDDLVMGNRFRGGIKKGAMPWKNRYIGNPVLTGIGRIIFKCPSGDFHCGLRGFTVDSYRRMDLRTTGMEFASEMVIKSNLLGLKISEVPTTLSPDGRSRPPHLRPWRDGWRHLIFMLVYSPRWLFFYPGMLLMAAGLFLLAYLEFSTLRIGTATLSIHTILYATMAVLIGFQSTSFAVLSQVYAVMEGLRPDAERLRKFRSVATLERGIGLGVLLVIIGLVGSAAAVGSWSEASFGHLDPNRMMRIVIPSAVSLTLGLQIILSSFFLYILGLRIRRLEITPS